MRKVRLADKLAEFSDYWRPRIVGQLNGQDVKLVKLQGDFIWHQHAAEDEMFLVLEGTLRMQYRDVTGNESEIEIGKGEFVIVPRGVEHRPSAPDEVHVLLFEPAGTLNTGNVRHALTVDEPEKSLAP